MAKKSNKYHPDIIEKDYTIGVLAGVTAGLTVFLLTLAAPLLLEKQYLSFFIVVLFYAILGTVVYVVGNLVLRYYFGRRK